MLSGNCNKDNFPLAFSEVELVIRPAPENYDFLRRFLPKLEWNALVDTARSVRYYLVESGLRSIQLTAVARRRDVTG